MKRRILTTLGFMFICIISITITGCKLFKSNKKQVNAVSKSKDAMMEKLDSYSMNTTIVSKTGIMDVTIEVNCNVDNKNKIEYCKTSTLGLVNVEQYYDFGNNKIYSKTDQMIGGDENNGKWISRKIDKKDKSQASTWLGLNDYLKDLTEEDKDGGKLYKGTIDNKKIQSAISDADNSSKIDVPTLTSKDIPIEIFINKSGYIEKINTELEVMSIKENVSINFSNFNDVGTITIPEEAK